MALRRDCPAFPTPLPRTRCVRTYTVSNGFDQVPAVARQLGLEVLLGLWIGRDSEHNEREIARGLKAVAENRAAIRAIVVGNEVLLRREQTREELAVLIRRVAEATGLPVTYAGVSEQAAIHRRDRLAAALRARSANEEVLLASCLVLAGERRQKTSAASTTLARPGTSLRNDRITSIRSSHHHGAESASHSGPRSSRSIRP
jgi:hypothetical protein